MIPKLMVIPPIAKKFICRLRKKKIIKAIDKEMAKLKITTKINLFDW
jgi:hypothetical protein